MNGYFIGLAATKRELEVCDTIEKRFPEAMAYCPVLVKEIKPRHKRKTRLIASIFPMYPRYFFIKLADVEQWTDLRLIPGFHSIMYRGNAPVIIGDHVIEEIFDLEQERRAEQRAAFVAEEVEVLEPGDQVKVRMTAKTFAGLLGTLRRDRLIDVQLANGRVVKASIPVELIEKIS